MVDMAIDRPDDAISTEGHLPEVGTDAALHGSGLFLFFRSHGRRLNRLERSTARGTPAFRSVPASLAGWMGGSSEALGTQSQVMGSSTHQNPSSFTFLKITMFLWRVRSSFLFRFPRRCEGVFVAVNSIRESPRVSGRIWVHVERLQNSGFSLLTLREL
jgi:hypothetical protein